MEKVVEREYVRSIDTTYREILDKESHHQHPIIEDSSSTIRWKADSSTSKLFDTDKINLNDLIEIFIGIGITKNSEAYRKLYRDMGYSLAGYWEIFYWEANNPDADLYQKCQ